MARVLVTGAGGRLGSEMTGALLGGGFEVIAAGHADLDITDEHVAGAVTAELKLSAVINCAAYTAVDRAEAERERAFAVNAAGAGNLAACCGRLGIPLIHISSDYILDTPAGRPHVPADRPRAACVYGQSKLEGERLIREAGCACLIVRTAWLFGARGNDFVKTVLRQAREGGEAAAAADQLGNPTPRAALAEALVQMLRQCLAPDFKAFGIYHYAGLPAVSRAGWAREVLTAAARAGLIERGAALKSVSRADFGLPAARPGDSRLDCGSTCRIFGLSMPDWRAYIEETLNHA